MKAALLVVDMSVEQVANISTRRKKLVVQSIQQLAELTGWALKLDSRLWLHSDQESTLSQVYPEWGVTMGVPGSEGADIIPELRSRGLEFVEKKHYSCFVDTDSTLMDKLKKEGVTDLYITGINTDYCIFNTAMDAFARGRFRTFVVEEGCGSIAGEAGHKQGLEWVRAHMGTDAVVSLAHAVKMISG